MRSTTFFNRMESHCQHTTSQIHLLTLKISTEFAASLRKKSIMMWSASAPFGIKVICKPMTNRNKFSTQLHLHLPSAMEGFSFSTDQVAQERHSLSHYSWLMFVHKDKWLLLPPHLVLRQYFLKEAERPTHGSKFQLTSTQKAFARI